MPRKSKKQKISSALFYKRIAEISKIKEAFALQKTIESSNLSKVGYILWQYPETRNSDITLALRYYSVFHPDMVIGETISFQNFYKLPKMYDIQRDRAKIQNDYKLFKANDSVKRGRKDRSDEYKNCYLKEKAEEICKTAEYSLFFDESGKEGPYFILAGIAIDSYDSNLKMYQQKISLMKEKLCQKYKVKDEELKFGNIKTSNYRFYIDFIDEIFKLEQIPTFYSISIENKGLKQHSKKIKSEKLLEFLLLEVLSDVIQKATKDSLLNSLVDLNIFLDIDGKSPDLLEAKDKENSLQNTLNERYKYFVNINKLQWIDSKDNILIQLSDLYVSSLNNIFSEKPDETPTAKAKKDFAWHFLNKVGIKNIADSDEKNFTFYNKAIVKFSDIFKDKDNQK